MIFNKEGGTTIITQEKATLIDFVKRLEDQYDSIKNDNIIINLFSLKNFSLSDLNEFLRISKKHRTSKHSFVVVTAQISFEEAPKEITVVPTLQEAYDLVEMEEIERDLGI